MFDDFVNEILGVADDVQQEYYLRAVSEMAVYFNTQPVVRCFVTNTNAFGHQISTVNMMKRLIAYGYNQTIELIYDDTGFPDRPTIQKLKILLPEIIIPGGGGAPAPINLNGCTITFLPYSNYYHGAAPLTPPALRVNFGFTGGYDDPTDLSRSLNTDYFLVLQPFQWGQAVFSNTILRYPAVRVNLDNFQPLLPRFNSRAFYMPDPTLTDAEWDQYLGTTTGAESANLLHAYATNTDPNDVSVNLCCAYGMSTGANALGVPAEDMLFNLTCGIVQYLNNAAFTARKPTVLLVLANVSATDYTALGQYLQGNNLNGNVTTTQFVANNNLPARVSIFQNGWDSDLLMGVIDNMQDNEVLIVSLPSLPPDLFNQMLYVSNLPIVFEGKNTANFAINFPNSFFWEATGGGGVVYPTLPLGAVAGAPATANQATANSMQMNPQNWPPANHPAQILGGFISNSNPINPPTPFTNYFTGLANFYHSQVNDKLFKAMQAFLSIRV